jgi:hypothetical protein
MNKEFEAVIMNTYAELCIMWRVAHVTDQAQAQEFDAKLKSLEAVVAAFDLNTTSELLGESAVAVAPVSAPAEPHSSRQNTPAAEPAIDDSGLVFGD